LPALSVYVVAEAPERSMVTRAPTIGAPDSSRT
jgi:hypothetical protein